MPRACVLVLLLSVAACGPGPGPGVPVGDPPPKPPEIKEDPEAVKALERAGVMLTRDGKAAGKPVVGAVIRGIGPPEGDGPFKHLRGLGYLRELEIQFAQNLTAKTVEPLENLTRLETLDLNHSAVDDETLAVLSRFPALTRLKLRAARLTHAGLTHLAKMTNLVELDLGSCAGLDDKAVMHLTGLNKLEKLEVPQCTALTDVGVARLAALSGLRSLDLRGVPAGDEGVKKLAGLKALKQLNLEDTKVGDAGVAALAGLPLEEINLNRTLIVAPALEKLPELRRVSVRQLRVGDGLIKAIAAVRYLQGADFSGCNLQKKDDDGKVLEDYSLRDIHVAALKDKKSLRSLDLSSTHVTTAVFATLRDMARLEEVIVSSVVKGGEGIITTEAVEQFRKENPKIKVKD